MSDSDDDRASRKHRHKHSSNRREHKKSHRRHKRDSSRESDTERHKRHRGISYDEPIRGEPDSRRRPPRTKSRSEQFDPTLRIKSEPTDRVPRIKPEPGDSHSGRDRTQGRQSQRPDRPVRDMEALRASTEPQPKNKEKPDFGLSGKLTEDTNTFRGVVIKYNEPPEARKPVRKWRLYPFKGEEPLPVLHLHRQSAYLLGRDRIVADIPIDHPSCSKQHAVFQYRMMEFRRSDGRKGLRVRPYIIDLNAANGTFVNNQKIETQRYVELFEKDVIKFGFSTREYVLLHDKIDTSEIHQEEDD